MTNVAVFEDHKARRDALELLIGLQPDMQCRGAVADCTHLVDTLKNDPPDVVLMDSDRPNVDGTEAVELRQTHFSSTCIIMQPVF